MFLDHTAHALFPLSRTLFVVGALELSINRVVVEALRPPPGHAASKALLVLDWAGLYLFYFATIIAAIALFWRGFASESQPRRVSQLPLPIALGTTALAGIAAAALPALANAAFALRLLAMGALLAAVVVAWRGASPIRAKLGISVWAACLLVPLALVALRPWLGHDAAARGAHNLLAFLPLVALLTPVWFAPRPLAISIRRSGPWLLAILCAGVIYSSLDEQPVASAQMFLTTFGIDLRDGVSASRLLVGASAAAALMWTIGACAVSEVRAQRDTSVGLALIMMGGLGLPWPLYTLLGVVGLWLLVDAAPFLHEEPIMQPGTRLSTAALLMLLAAALPMLGCAPKHGPRPRAGDAARDPMATRASDAEVKADADAETSLQGTGTSGAPGGAALSPNATAWLAEAELVRLTGEAKRIVAAVAADTTAWPRLAYLTDRIGARLSGSPQLAAAITWAQTTLIGEGLPTALQPVKVRHWVRGEESGNIVAPISHRLALLGLGGTVSTPARGITAKVVVVDSWEAMAAAKDRIKGAIVLFNVPMTSMASYGAIFGFRYYGASRAAELGAAAVLVRSLTAVSLHTPHTGTLSYKAGVKKIPAAAIATEDADLIARLVASGQPVSVTLRLQSRERPPAPSFNVIAELPGRVAPHEIVLISAHIDSWDIGQGAHDDGGGVVACMQALATIKRLGLTPRRTIRVVLFTNEENGTAGAEAYAAQYGKDAANHVLVFETDTGTFAPRGFTIAAPKATEATILGRWAQLAPIFALAGAPSLKTGWAGTDIEPMIDLGVLGATIDSANERYFDYHHTHADTLDKISPLDFTGNIAAIAVMAYVLADAPLRIDAADATSPR